MARNVNTSASNSTTASVLPLCDFAIKNAKWWKDNEYATFNLNFPDFGITVYGVTLRYKDGKPFLSFPSRKDKEGKYWNHVYINMCPDMIARIIEAVENT